VVKTPGTVFLFDVDNTLFDNDRFGSVLSERLRADFGSAEHDRYWEIYSRLRDQLGYADYLSAVQQFRAGLETHPNLLRLAAHILDYPFADGLFPRALDAVGHLGSFGPAIVLSDGSSTPQDPPLGDLGCGPWAGIGRHTQRTRAGSLANALPGAALCDDRRQTTNTRRDEEDLGNEAHDGVRQARPLRTCVRAYSDKSGTRHND
jgi:hypothetical protein